MAHDHAWKDVRVVIVSFLASEDLKLKASVMDIESLLLRSLGSLAVASCLLHGVLERAHTYYIDIFIY